MNELQKKLLADPNFGDGSLLMRPEDSSIQGASEDFMQYLQNPTQEMMPPAPVGNPVAIEDFDAMLEQDALDKSLKAPVSAPQNIATLVKNNMSGSFKGGSTPPINPPATTPQDDILAQLKAARDANAASLAGARQSDKMTELGNLIMKSGAMAGEGIVNQSGNTKIKLDAAQSAADESKFASEGAKGKLEALMQDYGIKKGMDDTKYSRDKDEQARKDRISDKTEDRAFKLAMLQNKANAASTATPKPSVGQQALDRGFAKDYNEWETSGKTLVDSNFKLLNEAINKLEKVKGDKFGTSGRVTGNLPDILRSEESISLRDDVQKTAMASLRATLGAQFTENEGERIMAKAYNQNLSPEENIKKIKSAIAEIKDRADNMEKRSEYFVDNAGTLKGLKSEPLGLESKPISSNEVERKTKDGKIAIYDSETKQFLRYK